MLVVFDPLRTSPSLLYANSRKIPPINQANINPKIPRTSVDVCASEYFPFSMLSNVIQDQTVKLMVMTKGNTNKIKPNKPIFEVELELIEVFILGIYPKNNNNK